MAKWIQPTNKPSDGQWLLMQVAVPEPGIIPMKKIVYEVGIYVESTYRVADENAPTVKTENYELRNASLCLLQGWYRVFTDVEGTHYHDVPGEVIGWQDFLQGTF